jgi:hypothetical protein
MLVTSGKPLVFATISQFKNKRLEITCEILPLSASTKMSVSSCNIFTLPGCLLLCLFSVRSFMQFTITSFRLNSFSLALANGSRS